jgi:probable addiction module antidote protein
MAIIYCHCGADHFFTFHREENDPAFFLRAVGDVAKARGMTNISKESGVKREALYRALSGNVQPKFDTIIKVLRAVNFKLKVEQSGP